MSSYVLDHLTIVNQIKRNLQDRYPSGYPILKELLQNADDARARRFILDALPGWPDAGNRLLKGPGLLVTNDGEFTPKDRKGILAFGDSVKVHDRAAIGRYGLGQKAVFHLCDAFVVHAFDEDHAERFCEVVNPFLEVDVPGNVTKTWDTLQEDDVDRLRSHRAPGRRAMFLWLPFRRPDLEPAPGVGLSPDQPRIDETLRELDRPDELQVLLSALRHLVSIEILKEGKTLCAVHVGDADRLLGPDAWRGGERPFRGRISVQVRGADARVAPFVGRETTLPDSPPAALRKSPHWPQTITVQTTESEKGEPHGAAILLRGGGLDALQPSQLTISWAVFLPVSEVADHVGASGASAAGVVLPIPAAGLGALHLLLHGYFFLDGGRSRIEGLSEPRSEDPGDAAALRVAWNTALRDDVVLPLVPAVLKDALDSNVLDDADLAHVAQAIAQSRWLTEERRRAVCGRHVLMRAVRGRRTVWRLEPAHAVVRPLPAAVADAPERLAALFPGMDAWAEERKLLLCVNQHISLVPATTCWTAEELQSLFSRLEPSAFQSSALTGLLGGILTATKLEDDHREAIGTHLERALRGALLAPRPLASAESISDVLRHAPPHVFFPLPRQVEEREVLGALASSAAGVLPVRGVWLLDAEPRPASPSDLVALLRSLEPLIGSENADQADQAAAAAVALLQGHPMTRLASREDFACLKVLKARDPDGGRTVPLSLGELVEREDRGFLFQQSPGAEHRLRALIAAVPDALPVIVAGRTAEILKEQGDDSPLQPRTADKRGVCAVVKAARRFGQAGERAALIANLEPTIADDRDALRMLCTGDASVRQSANALWCLDSDLVSVERLVAEFARQDDGFLFVPSVITSNLTDILRQHLGIRAIDSQKLERLLEGNVEAIRQIAPTESERAALLGIDGIGNELLLRLPIHDRSDGTVGRADDLYWEDDWSIPDELRPYVPTVRLVEGEREKERQQRIIRRWDCRWQVETALTLPAPERFCEAILGALAALSERGEMLPSETRLRLKEVRWIEADRSAVAPEEILSLPEVVAAAALDLLSRDGERPPFRTVDRLPAHIREHPALRYLTEKSFPDPKSSLDVLAELIGNAKPIGLLGRRENYPVEHFTALARAGAELELPAWPILRSVLSLVRDDKSIERIFSSLSQLSHESPRAAELAARHLDALAERARKKDATATAARQAYRYGFEAVAEWPDELQHRVFGATHVPTASGGWRSGREVARVGHGMAKTHLLASDCAGMFKRPDADGHPGAEGALALAAGMADGSDPSGDVDALEKSAAENLRRILTPWRDRVPPELVITLLGFLGRFPAMRQLAEEWKSDSKLAVESLWSDLDRHMKRSLKAGSPVDNPLQARVEELRFRITEVAGEYVRATALSGDEFDAPLGDDSELAVGNPQESYSRRVVVSAKDGSRKLVIHLQIRPISPSPYFEAASGMFRRFVEAVAVDCLRLHMSDQQAALDAFLDTVAGGDQPTLEDTRRLLRDRLPALLAEMKLPADSRCQRALREYEREEARIGRRSAADRKTAPEVLDDAKGALWEDVEHADSAAELLSAVRERIRGLGYSGDRVLFELFQNADDACVQQPTKAGGDDGLRIEYVSSPAGFRVVHWGRPINYLGADHDRARQLGHDRDLLNMLVMNFSEKRGLTGKFGLGFKSVHVLSDRVGIASRFVALRTRGGILPQEWEDGIDLAAGMSADGHRATLIDVPFADEPTAQTEGQAAVEKFAAAAPWLPVFARRIRGVDITGTLPRRIRCEISGFPPHLPSSGFLDVITVTDTAAATQRMLRFGLGRFHLLIGIGEDGPRGVPEHVGRLWNLAPLEERLRCGWLINGPFRVDPGRGRLAGTEDDRRQCFERLGEALGERLLALHDLASGHWDVLVETLSLAPSTEPEEFWSRLFDLMSRDATDDLARHLHRNTSGYARLLTERATAPSGLPQPFDRLVCASDVEECTTEAMADPGVLQAVEAWPSLRRRRGRIVAGEVAARLRSFGFGNVRGLALCDLLREELGGENRVDVDLAEQLGRVITRKTLEADPIRLEHDSLLRAAGQAAFRAQDGGWRNARDLILEAADNDDERRICGFAPEHALLDRAYADDAVAFFQVARVRSGYGFRLPRLVAEWARDAQDDGRRRAALRYVIDGEHRASLAEAMRSAHPSWLPKREGLFDHELLRDWPEEDRKRLVSELAPDQLVLRPSPSLPPPPPPLPGQVGQALECIHEWWRNQCAQQRERHEEATYPPNFSFSALRQTDPIDRAAWFTMFALACFQSLGRTQGEQHRSFIDHGWQDGWWPELAESQPPDSIEPWLDRLERWSDAEPFDQHAHAWRRTFVDLYTVARWLSNYEEIFRKFPNIVRERGPVSLIDLLRPSHSSALASLGTEAAPVDRTLGAGVNWMIRELTRNGLYGCSDADLTAPYCWMPTQRVRKLLVSLHAPITEASAKPDESRAIYGFIADHIGADRARFEGDFDLPLQFMTRSRYRDALGRCLAAAGYEMPAFGSE